MVHFFLKMLNGSYQPDKSKNHPNTSPEEYKFVSALPQSCCLHTARRLSVLNSRAPAENGSLRCIGYKVQNPCREMPLAYQPTEMFACSRTESIHECKDELGVSILLMSNWGVSLLHHRRYTPRRIWTAQIQKVFSDKLALLWAGISRVCEWPHTYPKVPDLYRWKTLACEISQGSISRRCKQTSRSNVITIAP